MKNNVKILFTSLLLVIISSKTIAATDKHDAPPQTGIDQIGLFQNNKVIAIKQNHYYTIGEINGTWSKQYPLKAIGLSFVDYTFSSDHGVYLVGGFNSIEKNNIARYKGKTVLIDSSNNLLNSWHYDSTFNSYAVYNDEITGSTGNNVYRLYKKGGSRIIHKRKRKTLISVILDNNGDSIICNPHTTRKINTLTSKFGCYKKNEWDFNGRWYESTLRIQTEPVKCGKWIIEAEQKGFNKKITGIKVRSLKTGKLINKPKVTDTSRFICINNSHIMLNTSQTSYSLPEMLPAEKFSCYNDEPIKITKHSNNFSICLTEQGHIGKLIKTP